MKKILAILLGLIIVVGCDNGRKSLILGTVNNSDLNGKWIFLVPVFYEDSLGVDSVVIENNKFYFERNEEFLADIRVDYHYRQNTENLLVVTEPGTINVKIDTVSYGCGTPQNDSLQVWKDLIIKLKAELNKTRSDLNYFVRVGDTANALIVKRHMEVVNEKFQNRTKNMAENFGSGTLYEFLMQRVTKQNQK